MLAKEIKIANLKKQKEFIIEQLSILSETNIDGDISYLYTGYLFPENRYYFENEGFKIEDFFNEEDGLSTDFCTHHLFTIRDNLKLTKDEYSEAENFNYNTNKNSTKFTGDEDCYENNPEN